MEQFAFLLLGILRGKFMEPLHFVSDQKLEMGKGVGDVRSLVEKSA